VVADPAPGTHATEPFEKYDPQVSRARKLSGVANLILITLLLVVAQRSQLLLGYEAYAWAMMLWVGVANAALLSNYNSALFSAQEVVRLLVLGVLCAQLSSVIAYAVMPLAVAGALWQWVDRESEVANATS
jgi:hypothetical protein